MMRLMLCKVVGFAWLISSSTLVSDTFVYLTNPTLDLRICYIETWMYLKTGSPKKDFHWFPFFKKIRKQLKGRGKILTHDLTHTRYFDWGKFQFFQNPSHLEWVYLYICAPPNFLFLLCHQGVSSTPPKKIPELRPPFVSEILWRFGSKVLKYPRTERSISLSVFYFEVSFYKTTEK